ncbi:MAG: putative toxin-antitoxin system toxin component, PIN family [Defluviitaleaceae bacterium]|nr:putative toxin-antitoxin system toxin component, PIN family [Defluviitaleaceae bacterium]
MIDTNVIVSAVYNPKSKTAAVLCHVCEKHELVLCDYIIAECYDVIMRKFPQHTPVFDNLLATLGYELVAAPRVGLEMSDPKDSPILNAAIIADVDIIVSGDKHFIELDIERPQVLSPTSYFETECRGEET